MDWDEFASRNWNDVRGLIREQWSDLTEDDLVEVRGSREKLIYKIQQRYVRSYGSALRGFESWQQRHFGNFIRPTVH